ncbi:FRIGIDA-like protein 3 [Linum perenne]
MEGDIGNGVGDRGATMQPHLLRETIAGFSGQVSNFAAELDSTAATIEARSRKLRLEEEKVDEARKELEKAQEAARRKSMEFEAREEAFECLMKKEISERRKLEELVKELRKEIELEKAEKELVEMKLKELEERGEELESLGGYLEMKVIQVRESEEELEKKRREVDEGLEKYQSKEKKLDMRLAELKMKEEIDAREKAKFEEQLTEFKQKQAEFEVRVVELNAKEREIDEKEKKCRESEMSTRSCSYELREKKLEEQFNMLSKRMDELELKRVKDLESIEKQIEITRRETALKAKKPSAESLDHSSEANIRHCVITSGKDIEMTEKLVEITGEAVMKAKELSESLNPSSEGNIRLCVLTGGKDLQIFLNEHSDDYDSVKDELERALKLSSDPAKLVLDAMVGFYPPRLKKGGVEFEETVVRKNCLWLLEWLTKMSPHIKPTVKNEAKELAFAWKRKMKSDAEYSLSILAFLQLLAAFELDNLFRYELEKLLPIITHYSQAPLLLRDLRFGDKMTSVIRKELLIKKQRDKAEALISAFELDSEFPSLILRKSNPKESNLPMSSSNTVSQMQSGKCSGAKRSRSDAFGEDNHAEHPDMSNVTAQPTEDSNLPERSSNDQADCSNPISINSNSEAEKENDSEDSEKENDSEDSEEENDSEDSQEENDSEDSEEENDSEDSVEESEDNSLPRILSFVPQCLAYISLHTLAQKIKTNTLCCIEVSDALQLASDPAEFVLGVVKNPSSLNLKAGLRSVCLKSPEHGPLLLLNYLWRMSPHIEPNVRREALSFAKDWRPKLAELFKDYLSDYFKDKEYIDGISFLLFLAAYKLECYFEEDELFSVFGRRCWCLHAVKLLVILGLKSSIPMRQFVGYLVREKQERKALYCIEEANIFECDPSARARLDNYLHKVSRGRRGRSVNQQLIDLNKKLAVWEDVENHELADETCQAFIRDLEKVKRTLQERKKAPN